MELDTHKQRLYYYNYLPYFNKHKEIRDDRLRLLEDIFFGSIKLVITLSIGFIAFGTALAGLSFINSLSFWCFLLTIVGGVLILCWSMAKYKNIVEDEEKKLHQANELYKKDKGSELRKMIADEETRGKKSSLWIPSILWSSIIVFLLFFLGFIFILFKIQNLIK